MASPSSCRQFNCNVDGYTIEGGAPYWSRSWCGNDWGCCRGLANKNLCNVSSPATYSQLQSIYLGCNAPRYQLCGNECLDFGFNSKNCGGTGVVCPERSFCSEAACKCFPGWEGALCQTALCDKPCDNGGTCSSPNVCTCAAGWEGPQCQTPTCASPCQNGGTCTSPGKCTCLTGWMGDQCQTAFLCDPRLKSIVLQNRGVSIVPAKVEWYNPNSAVASAFGQVIPATIFDPSLIPPGYACDWLPLNATTNCYTFETAWNGTRNAPTFKVTLPAETDITSAAVSEYAGSSGRKFQVKLYYMKDDKLTAYIFPSPSLLPLPSGPVSTVYASVFIPPYTANIDGPPPIFDAVKKEARYLSRNGDMTVITFDSNNVANISLQPKWMDTAKYGAVTGFSTADNNYVVSFYNNSAKKDVIYNATLKNAAVEIPVAGLYSVSQVNGRGLIVKNGSVYMYKDGTIAYVSNSGSGYSSGDATVSVNDTRIEIEIIVGERDESHPENFVLSTEKGQQPKSDGSSPSDTIKCTTITPGIAAISHRAAAAFLEAFKVDPDQANKMATPGVFAVTPRGVGGLHVTGTGVPGREWMFFATLIGIDPADPDGNRYDPRYNAKYGSLVAFDGIHIVLAVDNKIMWIPTSEVETYARYVVNNYKSVMVNGFVTSLYLTPDAFYYTTGSSLHRCVFSTKQTTTYFTGGEDIKVLGVVQGERGRQVFVAVTEDQEAQNKYTITDFKVINF